MTYFICSQCVSLKTSFLKKPNEDFIVKNLDKRLFKQILISLLGHSINLQNNSKKIDIILEKLNKDAIEAIQESMIANIKIGQLIVGVEMLTKFIFNLGYA